MSWDMLSICDDLLRRLSKLISMQVIEGRELIFKALQDADW